MWVRLVALATIVGIVVGAIGATVGLVTALDVQSVFVLLVVGGTVGTTSAWGIQQVVSTDTPYW